MRRRSVRAILDATEPDLTRKGLDVRVRVRLAGFAWHAIGDNKNNNQHSDHGKNQPFFEDRACTSSKS